MTVYSCLYTYPIMPLWHIRLIDLTPEFPKEPFLYKKVKILSRFNINFVNFQAKVDVNKDGNGANIFAYAFDLSREETSGCYFHEYIW